MKYLRNPKMRLKRLFRRKYYFTSSEFRRYNKKFCLRRAECGNGSGNRVCLARYKLRLTFSEQGPLEPHVPT